MAFNIDRSNTDPFYRYKMPRLIAKVEGKGNGIKTVIVNMTEVAKALSRPPTYPTKYFGCELGAQTLFDAKNDRYIVNGSHMDEKLQTLLDGFIKKFVLCPECSNPETNLVLFHAKRGTIMQRCIACGYNGSVDMRHKLTTFILKNPPDQDPAAVAATPSKGKKSKREKGKKEDEEKEKERGSPESTPTSGQEQMADLRESGHMISVPLSKNTGGGDDDDEDWGDEITEEAVSKRIGELSDAARGLTFTDDLEKSAEERLNIIYETIKIKRDEGELVKPAVVKGLFAEAERLEVNDKVPLVLVELLLNDKVLLQLQKYKNLFLRFCAQNQKAQKSLLGGLEILLAKEYPELMAKTSHILKALYDLDILEEAVILEWAKKPSKKYVSKEQCTQIQKEAHAFVTWLEQAEEESDEEEEEGDDEIIYSNTQKATEITVEPLKSPASSNPAVNGEKKTASAVAVDKNNDDDDDIDIDDI
ncbi:unnamed protein product [Candidula unifasciata]|uniref:Eukaryotic translation initiation factor 5 n=1 Tax=Candidula unifasciata TaxID=100452 RepID=A0A8S3ZHI7_9EUPU|nr:unnamed protein product [Candidula unifasciata]